MNETVFASKQLSKSYHKTVALDNVSFQMAKGRIYGLIGENGAGKTTLMRIMAGLAFPSAGNISLFGETEPESLQRNRHKMGFVIEYPALHSDMTAQENLRLHQVIKSSATHTQINELIQLVGLSAVGTKKVKHYSLGMKQRLGIAIALVGCPDLLILDEPMNGLDPVGVVEIRNLLINLCKQKNITILISSHMLAELYQLADQYIFLHHGKVLKTFTAEALDEECQKHICLKTNAVEKSITLLSSHLNISNYKILEDETICLFHCLDKQTQIAELMLRNGILVSNLSVEGENLEQYFMKLIGEVDT